MKLIYLNYTLCELAYQTHEEHLFEREWYINVDSIKYVEIEKSRLNIEVCPCDDDPRKIALVANIPILKSSNREVTKATKQKRK